MQVLYAHFYVQTETKPYVMSLNNAKPTYA